MIWWPAFDQVGPIDVKHPSERLAYDRAVIGLIALNLVRNRGTDGAHRGRNRDRRGDDRRPARPDPGAKQSVGGLSHLGGASLGIFQSGVADPTASVLPESLVDRFEAQPGVEDAAPIQLVTERAARTRPRRSSSAYGTTASCSAASSSPQARASGPDEAMVGERAGRTSSGPGARRHHRAQGPALPDDRRLRDRESPSRTAAWSCRCPLADRLAGRVGSGDDDRGCPRSRPRPQTRSPPSSNASFPGTTTISNPGEAARANPGFEIVTKAVLVIAVLALSWVGSPSPTRWRWRCWSAAASWPCWRRSAGAGPRWPASSSARAPGWACSAPRSGCSAASRSAT